MDLSPAWTVAETRTGAVFSACRADVAATGGIVTEADAAEGPAGTRVGGRVRGAAGGAAPTGGRATGGGGAGRGGATAARGAGAGAGAGSLFRTRVGVLSN